MNEPWILGPTNHTARPEELTLLSCLGPDTAPKNVDQLRQDIGGVGIRIQSTKEEETIVYATFLDGEKPVDGAAATMHNFSAGATYRLMAFDEEIVPNEVAKLSFAASVQASTNLTGAGTLSNIQQDPRETGDASKFSATNPALGIDLRVRFGAPAGGFEWMTGANSLVFLLRLTRQGSGGVPTAAVWLYEGGSAIRQLVAAAGVAGETLLTLYFDGAELASVSSSTIELRLIGTSVGGASIDVLSIAHVGYQVKSSATTVADTGWLPVPSYLGSSAVWAGGEPNRLPPAKTLLARFGATVDARQVVLAIRDQENAAGYVEWRTMPIGPAFVSPYPMSPGDLFGVARPPGVQYTPSGNPYGSRLRPKRRLPVRILGMSREEAVSLWLRLGWANGPASPVVMSLFPDDSILGPACTLWGYLTEDPEPMEAALELADDGGLPVVFNWQFYVTEV